MQEKWEDTGKVLDGNSVVTEWYQGGNEKESGKISSCSEMNRSINLSFSKKVRFFLCMCKNFSNFARFYV